MTVLPLILLLPLWRLMRQRLLALVQSSVSKFLQKALFCMLAPSCQHITPSSEGGWQQVESQMGPLPMALTSVRMHSPLISTCTQNFFDQGDHSP